MSVKVDSDYTLPKIDKYLSMEDLVFSLNHYVNMVKLVLISSVSLLTVQPVQADVIADTTLPNPSIVLSGELILIEGGTRPQNGANLFHSFAEFSIDTDESAYFSNPNGVERIFSRVTGNNKSEILGTLGILDSGNADLFFLNPNGVIFGRDARLDINGSFIVSTADAIGFSDRGVFSAVLPEESALLAINPNVFLFNTSPNMPLVRGEIKHQSESFDVLNGETLGLLGGSIAIDGGRIQAPNGRIELGSVDGGSTVSLLSINDQYQFAYDPALISNFQDINFSNKAYVQVRGQGRGSIQIVGESITLAERSYIGSSVSEGVNQASAGQILVTAQARVQLKNSNISSELTNSGDTTYGTDVEVVANQIIVNTGSEISSYLTNGSGRGGNVVLHAQDIHVSGQSAGGGDSTILSSIRGSSTGIAGNLDITTDNLRIEGRGRVATTFSSSDEGQAGNLTVRAEDTIEIRGEKARLVADVARGVTSGRGGNLLLDTSQLLIADGARISTSLLNSTNSEATAGTLTINADEITIMSDGPEEDWTFLVRGNSDRGNFTGILSESNDGNTQSAGPITITANVLEINNGGIAATAEALDAQTRSGAGGDIEITADRLMLNNGSILTGTSATEGGDITLEIADLLFLENNSRVSTSAGQISAGGDGGNIIIEIPNGFITALPQSNSDISANAFGGAGGDIMLQAQGIAGLVFRSRKNLIQQLGTDDPIQLNPENLQTNDMTAFSQVNSDLSGELSGRFNFVPSSPRELPSGLADASNQIEQTICRATQGSEFLVTGQGGVLPSPREQFRSEDLWEDWRLMDIAEVPSEERPTNPSMGYAVANPSYEQTPQLIEAQSWQTTPNGDIILIANAPSTNNATSLPILIPPSATCQTHNPATGGSAS